MLAVCVMDVNLSMWFSIKYNLLCTCGAKQFLSTINHGLNQDDNLKKWKWQKASNHQRFEYMKKKNRILYHTQVIECSW